MTEQKILLVLGGTSASLDVVRTAQEMGVYVIVTDNQENGVAKDLADESATVSTTDMDGLLRLIKEKNIDGVFCGPSEFNIQNTMKICKLANLPFYVTKEQWDICSNKESFKQLCRDNDVPTVLEYDVDLNSAHELSADDIKYPVIIKPVDGCSSKGISVCYSGDELKQAYDEALEFSESERVIVEKYIENGGTVTSVRYIANDGKLYLSLTGDTYIVDPYHRTALISAVTIFPSKHTDMYVKDIDERVQAMFETIGIKNGVLFMQSLTEGNHLYFHEMGLRLSGGLTYQITETANGVNDLKMMIRYALGGPMAYKEEIELIDPNLNGKIAASLCIPLKVGRIKS
ncbi:MAG: ATP-grasp domain-containing protein, partial [Clostridium sp.]|nr:ATP-grasp domain-containing protein [Clostridium sp.]